VKSTVLTVRMRMTTPGGVSAPEEQTWTTDENDPEERVRNELPLRRDPFGHEHIPGSTIAGSLRAHCRDIPELERTFGSEPGDAEQVASDIQVLDTTLQPVKPVRHTRTAIDRHRGAARGRTLRSIMMLPAGTEFTVVLRWNDATDSELEALRKRLRTWTPAIGRETSIGACRCAVTGLGEKLYDLSTEDGLVDWLAIRGPKDYPEPEAFPPPGPAASDGPLRKITLRIVNALHIGTGQTEQGGQGQQVSKGAARAPDRSLRLH
jgi:hypothetical protein